MGNACDADGQCLRPPIRQEIRQRSVSEGQQNLSLKKLIQFKKMNLTEQYNLKTLLGEGSYGSVFKVIHKQTQSVRAAKRIEKQKQSIQNLEEFLILKRLDHPNIIRLHDIYSEKRYVYIVMDYCEGGELFDRILKQGNLTQKQARLYMKQILSGIQHCHANQIMHRDLKPENIMFLNHEEKDLKIIDFGVGTSFQQNIKTTLKVGSIYYIAPEVIKKKYNYKCDIWSIGIILYILLTGRPPFIGHNDKDITKQILKGQVPYPEEKWSQISTSVKNLVERMLQLDPEKRISAKQALSHPWIKLGSEDGGRKILEGNKLKALKNFCEMNHFQAALMAYITHNFVSSQTLSSLEERFKSIDVNGDGKISWKQFSGCISQLYPELGEAKIKEMFSTVDQNNSGYIDYSEFITSSIDKSYLKNENLVERAFEMIDKDKNGFLSREELLGAFGGCSDDLQKQIMNQFDVNRDGVISKHEFKLAMKGLLKK